MAFYLRKSVKVGPIRFNLSGSGIGVSAGVKGLRVGSGPRGNYIHMGRHGLYYRATLSPGSEALSALPSSPRPQPLLSPPVNGGLTEIESGIVVEMTDSSSDATLEEIRLKQRRMRLWPVVALGGFCLWFVVLRMAPTWLALSSFAAVIAVVVWAARRDTMRKTVVLLYEFEDHLEAAYQGLHDAFDQLAGCGRTWHMEAEGRTSDWKRSAGATTLVRRRGIFLKKEEPRYVKTNVAIPMLPAGRQRLYFFPDRLLVFEGGSVGAVSYGQLRFEPTSTRFIEEEALPHDARVVDQTWKYVNKKGGPDRRFKDNRQLPVVCYGELRLQSETGLNEAFQTSKEDAPQVFAKAIEAMTQALAGSADSPSVSQSGMPAKGGSTRPHSLAG